jgi:hypothetical protein
MNAELSRRTFHRDYTPVGDCHQATASTFAAIPLSQMGRNHNAEGRTSYYGATGLNKAGKQLELITIIFILPATTLSRIEPIYNYTGANWRDFQPGNSFYRDDS